MIAIAKTEQLARLMFIRGLNQRGLAKLANVSVVSVNQIVNGTRKPSAPLAKKIVDALGVEFDEVFDLVPTNQQ